LNQPETHADAHVRARQLARTGAIAEAEREYARVLEAAPQDLESLNFLGLCALRAGRPEQGVHLLQRALAAAPDDLETLKNLGAAHQLLGQIEVGQELLRRALAREPDHYVARLHFAYGQEQLANPRRALVEYFRAVTTAQRRGLWLSPETTPEGLRELVVRAMSWIRQGRPELFHGVLEPLRQRFGAAALQRVSRALDLYLGALPASYADPRQRPLFFYVPDLPARPYWPRAEFPWIEQYESTCHSILEELHEVLRAATGFEAVHAGLDQQHQARLLESSAGQPAWDGYYFYRHGRPYEDNAGRCPRTIAALDALPLMRVRDHGPESMYSALTPGTRILPHRGVTNARLVVHLGLVVPEGCALSVCGEERGWRPGECFVFDDTYEHEAWNRGTETRYVLICDVWNPRLDEPERLALAELTGVIGDFNREAAFE